MRLYLSNDNAVTFTAKYITAHALIWINVLR